MNKTGNYSDYSEEYYSEGELSELEAHVLSKKIERKSSRNRNSISNFLKHIIALKNYMLDRNVKWYRKSVVVAALLYFMSPLDSVPDALPFIGFLDDMGVIMWTVKFMGKELNKYYR